MCKLLTGCTGSETRFIIRSLEGKLRIGLAEKTLVTALAHAIVFKEIGARAGRGDRSAVADAFSAGDKKVPEAVLAERLAKGAEIVKHVYRWV